MEEPMTPKRATCPVGGTLGNKKLIGEDLAYEIGACPPMGEKECYISSQYYSELKDKLPIFTNQGCITTALRC
jgi:hypothetical protein